jgi:hypothetical protein
MNTRNEVPTKLRLACGHDVAHEIGTRIFNFYDMRDGEITRLADRPEPDTSGRLPNGEAWWVDTTAGFLDGSRMICLDCAERKGWFENIENSVKRDAARRRNRDYRLGWNAYERGSQDALERADDRHVSREWYDGFFDAAAGRPKGHSKHCRTCAEWAH